MLRSAAKNFHSVSVVVNPQRYADVISNLKDNNGETSFALRQDLALEAFQHTARYDTVISNYLAKQQLKGSDSEFPETLTPVLKKVTDLRYGENPINRRHFIPTLIQQMGLIKCNNAMVKPYLIIILLI